MDEYNHVNVWCMFVYDFWFGTLLISWVEFPICSCLCVSMCLAFISVYGMCVCIGMNAIEYAILQIVYAVLQAAFICL